MGRQLQELLSRRVLLPPARRSTQVCHAVVHLTFTHVPATCVCVYSFLHPYPSLPLSSILPPPPSSLLPPPSFSLLLPSLLLSLLLHTEQLSSIPEFAQLGPLFRSSDKPTELTESETEYVVNCVKHVFSKHIVFQVCPYLSVCLSCYLAVCSLKVTVSASIIPCKSTPLASLILRLHSCHLIIPCEGHMHAGTLHFYQYN